PQLASAPPRNLLARSLPLGRSKFRRIPKSRNMNGSAARTSLGIFLPWQLAAVRQRRYTRATWGAAEYSPFRKTLDRRAAYPGKPSRLFLRCRREQRGAFGPD